MKKIVTLVVVAALTLSAAFTQVLPKSGVKNTMWTGLGQQYPELHNGEGKTPNVRLFGLYETLQARIDVSQFTVEAMLNWAAETNWKFNEFDNITFANTGKTPFYYTNHSNQGGDLTNGWTNSDYVNFIWNVLSKDKSDLDFGMGTRLSWVIGPAPVCNGHYWEPYAHIVQGGLKQAEPGHADVAGYTHYDNVYADHALGIRYRYNDFIEVGASIPSGVTTDKMLFNAAFAIKPVDLFRAAVAFEDIGKDSTDFYTGLSLYLKKLTIDAYLEIQDIGNDKDDRTWGTGATVTWYPVKELMVRPEGGMTVYRSSDYTPAFYVGGRVEWTMNKQFMFGGFTSMAWGSRDERWSKYDATKEWNGGYVFDIRPDVTYTIDQRNSLTAAFDYQYRKAFNNEDYSIWATGVYWTYKR